MSDAKQSPEVARVGVAEACELLDAGYVYLDVRSSIEFEQGHAPGAYNIPLMHAGEDGFEPNPDFVRVAQAIFPAATPLLVACQSGGRSVPAVAALRQAGFREVVELRTGFDGCRDAFGRREPGWARCGKPTVIGGGELGYAELTRRAAATNTQ